MSIGGTSERPSSEQAAGPMRGEATESSPVVLDRNLACVRCTYNLRGLPANGNCPECGEPIANSTRGMLPRIVSAEYCNKVISGLTLVTRGTMCVFVFLIAAIARSILSPGLMPTWVGVVVYALIVAVSGLMTVGYWRITTPDAGQPKDAQPATARRIVRGSVVFTLSATLLYLSATLIEPRSLVNLSGRSFEALIDVFQISLLVAWVTRQSAMAAYVAWLARRVPDPSMNKRAKRYRWLLPSIFIGLFLAYGLGLLLSSVMLWLLLGDLRARLLGVARLIREGCDERASA